MDMKRMFYIIGLLLAFVFFKLYVGEHFISDTTYRRLVKEDFDKKRKAVNNEELFEIFNRKLNLYEREALTFLYAYMPVGDLADYSGDYFLEQVRLSRKVMKEMPWGKEIPEDIFRHFVLPVRVNNENLDHSRKVFFEALCDRVRNLGLREAALEVNHWCHEKVTYSPSDSRTSAPLASVCSAMGRCGEESTFTVAALRAVGIPARQVYTPRWAHTDDNHAWVEVWVDGNWLFMGACEPEPVLNYGWFNDSAARGMLMHSKVFGRYEKHEDVVHRTPLYTEINLTSNYAPVSRGEIVVVDKEGKPVQEAKIEYKIYNYSEFHTAVTQYTDCNGKAVLHAGKGDLMVWASKNKKYGYAKVSFREDFVQKIVLENLPVLPFRQTVAWIPPVSNQTFQPMEEDLKKENKKRLAYEDSVRTVYTETFFNSPTAESFVQQNKLPEEVIPLLVAAKGNHKVISQFLLDAQQNGRLQKAVSLLSVISWKDLRDMQREVLDDHLLYSISETREDEVYNSYVLNPRVADEMVLPYKQFFQTVLSHHLQQNFRNNPLELKAWCETHLEVREELNYPNMLVSPVGVWKTRITDRRSRKVFFVSVLRSLGVPAWMDAVTGRVYCYRRNHQNLEICFSDEMPVNKTRKGRLVLDYHGGISIEDPKYYSHFTLSELSQGTFKLLEYEESNEGKGSATWNSTFKEGVELEAGIYLLTSGVRGKDGSVPAEMLLFEIKEGKTTHVKLNLDEFSDESSAIRGRIDIPLLVQQVPFLREMAECSEETYNVLALLGVNEEPTNHALKDIAILGREFERYIGRSYFLFTDKEGAKKYKVEDFPGLPEHIVYGVDEQHMIQKYLTGLLQLSGTVHLPVVVVFNGKGDMVFTSQGYTIGLGEQIIKEVKKLTNK